MMLCDLGLMALKGVIKSPLMGLMSLQYLTDATKTALVSHFEFISHKSCAAVSKWYLMFPDTPEIEDFQFVQKGIDL